MRFSLISTIFHSRTDAASGLGLVHAVPELALECRLGDIGKRLGEPVLGIPETQPPHPGGIDEDAA